jgi:hypothetical protein
MKSTLDVALRTALVAEKVFQVDRSDSRFIEKPYLTAPTATVQALAGTYSVSTTTTNEDRLSITDEVVVSTHVFGFEDLLSRFDLFADFAEDMAFEVARKIDKYALNVVLEAGTGAYTTPAGGFTTVANINVIMANLIAKVAGYSESYKGLFLVIENTDVPGFIQAQATNGFSYADAALNNGWMTSYMGVDIYVVRTGCFEDDATTSDSGSQTWTNSGHRLFGVKGTATYASPRGVQYNEKDVTAKTGKEIVIWGLIGAKVWAPQADLIVDITLTS